MDILPFELIRGRIPSSMNESCSNPYLSGYKIGRSIICGVISNQKANRPLSVKRVINSTIETVKQLDFMHGKIFFNISSYLFISCFFFKVSENFRTSLCRYEW